MATNIKSIPIGQSIPVGRWSIPLNKNTFVSTLLLIVVLLIARQLLPISVDQVFTMTVSKNKTQITKIDQVRDVELYQNIDVDRIDFTDKNRFRHPVLGDLGYAEDFFADIASSFKVKVAADYLFYVSSDDGFALSIDGNRLCQWDGDRPLTTDVCRVRLEAGLHNFSLNYFQGFGNAGLKMQYSNSNDGTQFFMGEESKYLSFR